MLRATLFDALSLPHPAYAELTRSITPVEPHRLGALDVLVKREDLATPPPGPPFSKVRGVAAHIAARPWAKTIGVLDTFHSQGGWAVAYICQALGRECVVFYPEYKGETGPREYQRRAQALGAELVPLPAGRSAVLYHRAKKLLFEHHHEPYLMPNALKLTESVSETAAQVARSPELHDCRVWVVSASSGTLAAGVLRGLSQIRSRARLIVHMGYSRPEGAVRSYLAAASGCDPSQVAIVDEGYAYRDAVDEVLPFPCNTYYDAKAARWLRVAGETLRLLQPVALWNIG